MNARIANDLKTSSKTFMDLVEPELSKAIGGYFLAVEGVSADEMARLLDTLAGIDFWNVQEGEGIRGIATRIQRGKSWRTFTVRNQRMSGARTEYEKRKQAIEEGLLYPELTLQAYVDNGKLLSYAVAKTVDIVKMIDIGKAIVKHTGPDQYGQASFYVVKWDDMKQMGCQILIGEQKEKEREVVAYEHKQCYQSTLPGMWQCC